MTSVNHPFIFRVYSSNRCLQYFEEQMSCLPAFGFLVMTFLGQNPVWRKIIVDNKCSKQVKNFKYLSFEISYKNEKDV
jgi:hypothetical protein